MDKGPLLVSAMAFTPQAAVAAMFALVAAFLARSRVAGVVALLVVVAFGAILTPRALPDSQAAATRLAPRLTVMSVNADDGRASVSQLLSIIRRYQVDVLAVSELKTAGDRLDQEGLRAMLPHEVRSARSRGGGTALWSRVPALLRLPRPTISGQPSEPAVRIAASGALFDIWVSHPLRPTEPALFDDWRQRLRALPDARAHAVPQVVLGDLNATLDHSELRHVLRRGFQDSASATGNGLVMTWPTNYVPALALDHVLADRRLVVEQFSAITVSGTDHKAVVARLAVPSP